MRCIHIQLLIVLLCLQCLYVHCFMPHFKKCQLSKFPSSIKFLLKPQQISTKHPLQMKSSPKSNTDKSIIWKRLWGQIAHVTGIMPALIGFLFIFPSLSHARSSVKSAEPSSTIQRGRGPKGKQVIDNKDSGEVRKGGFFGRSVATTDDVDDEYDELVEESEAAFQKKLTYVGYGLAAVVVMASLLSDGTPKVSSQRRKGKPSAPVSTVKPTGSRVDPTKKVVVKEEPEDDEDDLFDEDIIKPSKPAASIRAIPKATPPAPKLLNIPKMNPSTTNLPSKPTMNDDDNVDDNDDIEFVTSTQEEEDYVPPPKASNTSSIPKRKPLVPPPPPPQVKQPMTIEPVDDDEDDFFEPPTISAPAPAPVTAKKQGGFLSRLFQKPGGDRDTDLRKVVGTQDTAAPLRSAVASILARYAPSDVFPEFSPEGISYDLRVDDVPEGEDPKLLEEIASESSLTKEQAAEAFAQVTSAMLVALTDLAVDASEKKMDEAIILEYLDNIAIFISNAGGLFGLLYTGVTIEPVQYNGKAKKGSVENLYFQFFKSTSEFEFKKSMAMFTGGLGAGEDGAPLDGAETASAVKSPEETAQEELMTRRQESMGLLQRALAIKENKRSSLEQKATKELLMSGLGGGGGGGGLGDLMGALTGKGGPGGVDMKALEEMMAAAGGPGGPGGGAPGGFPNIPGMGGFGGDDDPTKNMSQEEMMEVTKQSVAELKSLLAEGGVTKEMVKEMEKSMGLDFGMFVKMLNNPAAKANAKGLGSDVNEMIEMFKELNKIKNS